QSHGVLQRARHHGALARHRHLLSAIRQLCGQSHPVRARCPRRQPGPPRRGGLRPVRRITSAAASTAPRAMEPRADSCPATVQEHPPPSSRPTAASGALPASPPPPLPPVPPAPLPALPPAPAAPSLGKPSAPPSRIPPSVPASKEQPAMGTWPHWCRLVLQVSVVQGLPSPHSRFELQQPGCSVSVQVPVDCVQRSVVQNRPSLQSLSDRQQPGKPACWHR